MIEPPRWPRRSALLDALASSIAALGLDHPVRVGIDGVDAAGKSTLADGLVHALHPYRRPVLRASIDGFHHPRAIRYRLGRHSPEGYFRHSFDLEAIAVNLLQPLGPHGSRRVRRAIFDHRADAPAAAPEEIVATDAILLFDGVFLHRRELIPYWDATLFLDAPFDVTVPRAAARDASPPGVDAPENRRYVDGQRLYLRDCDPRAIASCVIDNTRVDQPRVVAWRAPLDSASLP